MENTALRRDWRSVGGPFGPKWAWHSRGVHIFKRFVFNSFSRIHAIRRVLRSLGGSWASPGTLWGAPGAQQPDQGHGHSEASFRSCLAVAGGQPREPQTAKHDVQVCRKPSSRQACVQNPCKTRGFGAIVATPGSKTRGICMFVCSLRAAASPKRVPRRA